jgi:hypothetical protein
MLSNLIDGLLWIPVITLLCYTPIVCYLDWKNREVEPYWWTELIAANTPLLVIFYLSQIYSWWMFVISIVAVAIYYVLMLMHYIEGADFMYIMFIMLFFVYNPISSHWLMALPFSIFFAACTGIAGVWVLTYNLVKGNGVSFDVPRHVPMMVVVSAALILTVMLA